MIDFRLYRVKVYPPAQRDLFDSLTPSEILSTTIEEHPSKELRKNTHWHIGNISFLDDAGGIYFRLGRTTNTKMEFYQNGNFIDEEFESSPYTHIILDISSEVCAIAKKSRLTQTVTGISNQFVRLLKKSDYATARNIDFEIDALNDPNEFISYLNNSFQTTRFWSTFSRPNAWDVDSDFVKPMSGTLKESNGQSGKAEFVGEDLNVEVLERITRSAAASGNNAGATLKLSENERHVKKQLKGNPVETSVQSVDEKEDRLNLLHWIRETYRSIRGHVHNNDD